MSKLRFESPADTRIAGEQSGATYAEAAIALSLVLVFVFSVINVIEVLLLHLNATSALMTAGRSTVQRAAVSTPPEGCELYASRAFAAQFVRAKFAGSAGPVTMQRQAINGEISGFRFSTEIEVPCYFCRLLPGLPGNLFNYVQNVTIAEEAAGTCPTVT